MEFNKHKIGFIYNLDFNLEKYWGRTEEAYIKFYLSLIHLIEYLY